MIEAVRELDTAEGLPRSTGAFLYVVPRLEERGLRRPRNLMAGNGSQNSAGPMIAVRCAALNTSQ